MRRAQPTAGPIGRRPVPSATSACEQLTVLRMAPTTRLSAPAARMAVSRQRVRADDTHRPVAATGPLRDGCRLRATGCADDLEQAQPKRGGRRGVGKCCIDRGAEARSRHVHTSISRPYRNE
eukprot:882932-Prymnesium_polylepis.1